MSTYVLMKILESAPERYDRGINILTFGRLNKIYDQLVLYIKKDQRVLDIGCGTGALTLRAARRGAFVKGIDINQQMLEIAEQRAKKINVVENVTLTEMGAAELGNEESNSYDVIMSGLCFSELSDDELNYTLEMILEILKPDGLLLVADETNAKNIFKKIIIGTIRIPLTIITYLFTQTTTKAIKNLQERIVEAGFNLISIRRSILDDFIEIAAKKPIGDKK